MRTKRSPGTPATRSVAEVQSLIHLLHETERRVARRLCNVVESERLSVAQWHVLFLLADGTGRPMAELAEYTLLPAATMTRQIETMVRQRLVHRARDESDRRRVLVHITHDGRARYDRLAHRIERRQQAILDDTDAARLRRLVESLNEPGP